MRIVEGAITMLVAIIAIFMLPDFPHNSRGFTQEELQLAQLRMLEDVSSFYCFRRNGFPRKHILIR